MSFSTYPQKRANYPQGYPRYDTRFTPPFPHTNKAVFPAVDTQTKNSYTFPRANSITITG